MRLFVCQLSPLREAAIAEAAILLGVYMEKSCSVNEKKKDKMDESKKSWKFCDFLMTR